MSKRLLILMCSIFLIVPLLFMGCGSDGSAGANGTNGSNGINGTNGVNGTNGTNALATPQAESCSVCHSTAGAEHQAGYNQLYQDNVIVVTNLTYTFDAVNGKDIVSFKVTKAGVNVSAWALQNSNIYFTGYDPATRQFNVAGDARLSIKGSGSGLTYDAGTNTSTSSKNSVDNVSLTTKTGLVVVYGYDESSGVITGSRVQQAKYNYAALVNTGVDYASAANVAGCEKCHMKNYVKHGNIAGRVSRNDATGFYVCKSCHLDNGPGTDFIWQMLVDDPVAAVAIENGGAYTTAQQTKYAYKTRLMNDVHMSHAMEFEYPQSMRNCNTCHEGKLDRILTDNNFTLETCKSCHPVTGSAQAEKTQPALADIIPHTWTSSTVCSLCHTSGGSGIAPTFSTIHSGYDPMIYTSAGVKYSSAITVTINSVTRIDNTHLSFAFTASGSAGGVSAAGITPTAMASYYGWDTKDFVGAAPAPTVTTVSAGSWTATVNMSAVADNIVAGNIRRIEVAVRPVLRSADNTIALALNAPSKTVDLTTNAFVNYYPAIVKVPTGCNNCHDALATTFHSPDRGGNIVVCRMCHVKTSGGSHLEMESRSIDSYAHAIHSFQAFDIQNVHFDNAVQTMFYDLHVESHYPMFGDNDCESCHNAGTYNVPNQAKSLPGVMSASRYPLIGATRTIGTVPSYIGGPASVACGGCHRADLIKEDDEVDLMAFNSHTRTNGYLLENANILTVMWQVMSSFEETVVLPLP